MTNTNVNFSAVDFVENLRKALAYPTSNVIEEKVREMFDDAGFAEFKNILSADMEKRIWDSILVSMDVDGISNESTTWYLHEVISNNMYIWNSLENNHDNIISDILHDASGYLAINLNDSQFEDWHGWFDEHISVWRWVDVCTSKYDNKPITEHMDIIEKYCNETNNDVQMFLDSETSTNVEEKTNFPYKQVLDFNMGAEITNMVFAILNTKTYDGDMGVTIVKGVSPMMLEDYGFDTEECTEIGKIKVGDSWTNSMYGNGVVVVRMA